MVVARIVDINPYLLEIVKGMILFQYCPVVDLPIADPLKSVYGVNIQFPNKNYVFLIFMPITPMEQGTYTLSVKLSGMKQDEYYGIFTPTEPNKR